MEAALADVPVAGAGEGEGPSEAGPRSLSLADAGEGCSDGCQAERERDAHDAFDSTVLETHMPDEHLKKSLSSF